MLALSGTPTQEGEPSELLRNAPTLDPASQRWITFRVTSGEFTWIGISSPYYDLHPGGRVFLERTRESDCTEPFECHDVQKISQVLLDRYSRRGLLLTEYWGWVIIKCIAICY